MFYLIISQRRTVKNWFLRVKTSLFKAFATLKITIFGCYLWCLMFGNKVLLFSQKNILVWRGYSLCNVKVLAPRDYTFRNLSTRGYYFCIKWMYGQWPQKITLFVILAQGVTIFVLNECMGDDHKGLHFS